MELYQLRTFVIVAEEKNVTEAAKRLFTTPPSVSAHIKALETEWNVVLFDRTPMGMKITEQGKILKEKAESTLRAAQDLANHATHFQDHLIGQINFGLNASAIFLKVPELVTKLNQRSPGIDLKVVPSHTGQILEDLQTRKLDAGYIFGDSPNPRISAHRLHTAELVVAGPAAWADQIEQASWPDIAALSWIASPRYCPLQNIANKLFNKHGLKQNHVVQSVDEITKCEMVSAGLGLALLEKSEAEQAQARGKIVIWETEPIKCDLYLAYVASRRNEPLIQAVEGIILQLWPEKWPLRQII